MTSNSSDWGLFVRRRARASCVLGRRALRLTSLAKTARIPTPASFQVTHVVMWQSLGALAEAPVGRRRRRRRRSRTSPRQGDRQSGRARAAAARRTGPHVFAGHGVERDLRFDERAKHRRKRPQLVHQKRRRVVRRENHVPPVFDMEGLGWGIARTRGPNARRIPPPKRRSASEEGGQTRRKGESCEALVTRGRCRRRA